MRLRVPANVVIGAVAIATVLTTSAVIAWRVSNATIAAGFWWEDAAFALSADDARKIGGALRADEVTRMQRISRGEIERAYRGLRITLSGNHDAFWHVAVVGEPITVTRNHMTYPFSMAGQSHVFGPLGGFGSVAFAILAHNAIDYAPTDASRAQIVDAIGRGIGRAAVHEFAHQALGADNLRHIDNRTDEQSYEYGSADRAAQYYGELRWTTAWPVLEDKFGK
ncbi:MAG TPA: hypothetical protein VL693_03195 [Vicinamibacterales bacterium]|jgi:hypothetical protein|nr:hypothetical protein [Vicinamibacterales bacterium]